MKPSGNIAKGYGMTMFEQKIDCYLLMARKIPGCPKCGKQPVFVENGARFPESHIFCCPECGIYAKGDVSFLGALINWCERDGLDMGQVQREIDNEKEMPIDEEPVQLTDDEVRRMLHGKNCIEHMEDIMSSALAILCISHGVLICHADMDRAIEGIEYRVRDLQREMNSIKVVRHNEQNPNR